MAKLERNEDSNATTSGNEENESAPSGLIAGIRSWVFKRPLVVAILGSAIGQAGFLALAKLYEPEKIPQTENMPQIIRAATIEDTSSAVGIGNKATKKDLSPAVEGRAPEAATKTDPAADPEKPKGNDSKPADPNPADPNPADPKPDPIEEDLEDQEGSVDLVEAAKNIKQILKDPEATADLAKNIDPKVLAAIVKELDGESAKKMLEIVSSEEVAEFLEKVPPEKIAEVLKKIPPEKAAEMLKKIDPKKLAEVLKEISPEDASKIIDQVSAKDIEEALKKNDPDMPANARRSGASTSTSAGKKGSEGNADQAPDQDPDLEKNLKVPPEPPSNIKPKVVKAENVRFVPSLKSQKEILTSWPPQEGQNVFLGVDKINLFNPFDTTKFTGVDKELMERLVEGIRNVKPKIGAITIRGEDLSPAVAATLKGKLHKIIIRGGEVTEEAAKNFSKTKNLTLEGDTKISPGALKTLIQNGVETIFFNHSDLPLDLFNALSPDEKKKLRRLSVSAVNFTPEVAAQMGGYKLAVYGKNIKAEAVEALPTDTKLYLDNPRDIPLDVLAAMKVSQLGFSFGRLTPEIARIIGAKKIIPHSNPMGNTDPDVGLVIEPEAESILKKRGLM
jgi:hypothetical protein